MTQLPRPPHLNEEGALAFSVPSVVEAYHHRPSYPLAVASFLAGLCAPDQASVIELGCGTGELTRALVPLVEQITAVDISAPMLARAQRMPGGDHPRIRWHLGQAEEFPVGPYGLAVAGDSLHWMDWDVLLPRLAREVSPPRLAILTVSIVEEPWADSIATIARRYSPVRDWQPYNAVDLVTARGLFRATDEQRFREHVSQPVAEYIESFHARASFVRERMDRAEEFDQAVETLVKPYAVDGLLELLVEARITWGQPLDRA